MFEYKVVLMQDKDKFEQTISRLCNEGWMLQGGVSICPERGLVADSFMQAMRRHPRSIKKAQRLLANPDDESANATLDAGHSKNA